MTRKQRPYVIEWAAPAKRALQRLPEKVATAAIEFIYGPVTDNPHRVGRPLRFELDGTPVIPLPHPSGASGWLNDPANRERLATATARVREELSGVYPQKK